MRSLLNILTRNAPRIIKTLTIPTYLTYQHYYSQPFFSKINCANDPFILDEAITSIEKNTIVIRLNGNQVGDAYCFADNYLVSVRQSYELQSEESSHKNYEFFVGEKKLPGSFKIIGHFENLTFFQHTSKIGVHHLPFEEENQPFLISPVQIYMKRGYPSIRDGYLVAQDSGFGVVDGKGYVGGLIIKDGKAAGIITSIGRDLEKGFIRIIQWRYLPNILRFLQKNKSSQFGISAKVQADRDGIQVIRISPNSPLRNDLMMGDTIVKANNQKIKEVEALQRINILSEGNLTLQVIRDDTQIEIKVQLE